MIQLIPPYGLKLKYYRVSKGWTQSYLEDIALLPPGSVSRIETFKINPTKETLFKLAKAMELSREELILLFCIDNK